MTLLFGPKTIDEITCEDVLSLIPGVSEGRQIDYKRSIPEGEKGARDFLADVCAMANAAGGYLFYGIEEDRDENGVSTGNPRKIVGVDNVNEDRTILEYQQRINQNIEPRIIGHRIRFVTMLDGVKVMIVYVPHSLLAPHRVTYRGSKDFYVRHDRNNMHMDISELRYAFIDAAQLPTQIDQYRRLRLATILAGDTPIELLRESPVYVLHIISISRFRGSAMIDVTTIRNHEMPTVFSTTSRKRLNVDGVLFHGDITNDWERLYLQVFRDGVCECCETKQAYREAEDGPILLPSKSLEGGTIETVEACLKLMQEQNCALPIYVGLSILRAKGAVMGRPGPFFRHEMRHTDYRIDKDVVLMPIATFDSYEPDVAALMKPAFDTLWQASNATRSPSYDEQGIWRGDPRRS